MLLSNPTPIQTARKSRRDVAPLFLIHDASGTIFDYFKLGSLNRRVYGIHDPRFANSGGGGWESVDEMAQAYTLFIKKVVQRGEIVLGGWSFGGLLAIQIAYLLSLSGGPKVVGIILIDSVNPGHRNGIDMELQAPKLPGVSTETREMVLAALVRAIGLADDWEPPIWNIKSSASNLKSPPVILLRAEGYIPMEDEKESCVLDATRMLEELGWENYQHGFISTVLNLPGNHYSIFQEANLATTTACLREALNKLEILGTEDRLLI